MEQELYINIQKAKRKIRMVVIISVWLKLTFKIRGKIIHAQISSFLPQLCTCKFFNFPQINIQYFKTRFLLQVKGFLIILKIN